MLHDILLTIQLWSTLSNHLAGVVFSPKLDGDIKPPCDQSKLSAAQLVEKECAVFNKAINDLSGYWEGARFDDNPIEIKKVTCSNQTKLTWDDFEDVKCYLKAPIRELHKYKDCLG